jgi:hypothetical protein
VRHGLAANASQMALPADKVDRAIFRHRVDELIAQGYAVIIRGYIVPTEKGLRVLMAEADSPMNKPHKPKPKAAA